MEITFLSQFPALALLHNGRESSIAPSLRWVKSPFAFVMSALRISMLLIRVVPKRCAQPLLLLLLLLLPMLYNSCCCTTAADAAQQSNHLGCRSNSLADEKVLPIFTKANTGHIFKMHSQMTRANYTVFANREYWQGKEGRQGRQVGEADRGGR